eukprot:scaffold872_cov421-Prasinococcus_capsulatus_cf.AAC.9
MHVSLGLTTRHHMDRPPASSTCCKAVSLLARVFRSPCDSQWSGFGTAAFPQRQAGLEVAFHRMVPHFSFGHHKIKMTGLRLCPLDLAHHGHFFASSRELGSQ